MSKASKQPTQKIETGKTARKEESGIKVFPKTDWPKTPKEVIKLVVSTFLNLFA